MKHTIKRELHRRVRHLCGAVGLPCVGTALVIQAVAKTIILPLSKPLGLSEDHFSERAVKHDYALGSLLFLKGVKCTAQLGVDLLVMKKSSKYASASIKTSVVDPIVRAIQQKHHHPHMAIVSPKKTFVEGVRRMVGLFKDVHPH